MTPVIEQSVTFNATPAKLYAALHGFGQTHRRHRHACQDQPQSRRKVVRVRRNDSGKESVLVPNRMIVQTWRSSEWKKADPDSILVVSFEKSAGGGAQVQLVHVGVPEYDHEGVTQGWLKFYWEPWKEYLAARKRIVIWQ